jgi:hypothetical protein
MPSAPSQQEHNSRKIWIATIAVIVLLGALFVWRSARIAAAMSTPVSLTAQQLQEAPANAPTKIVIEITDSSSKGSEGTLRGKLLQKKTEELYTRTASDVSIHFNDKTKLVMGKLADLHSAAIIHVTGTAREDKSIDAQQLVILTTYVKVQ